MKELALFIVLVVVLGIGGFLYRYTLEQSLPMVPEGVECTLEARICPDGTVVGRTGPRCEFAACPTTEAATSTSETTTSSPERATSTSEGI